MLSSKPVKTNAVPKSRVFVVMHYIRYARLMFPCFCRGLYDTCYFCWGYSCASLILPSNVNRNLSRIELRKELSLKTLAASKKCIFKYSVQVFARCYEPNSLENSRAPTWAVSHHRLCVRFLVVSINNSELFLVIIGEYFSLRWMAAFCCYNV